MQIRKDYVILTTGIILFLLLNYILIFGIAKDQIKNEIKDELKNEIKNALENDTKINVKNEIGTYRSYGSIESQSLMLYNNLWGVTDKEKEKGTTKSYLYYVFDGNFGWEWNRPDAKSNPYDLPAYPEVIVGKKPGSNEDSTSPYFPIKLSDVKSLTVEIEYKYVKPAKGDYNLAFDIYFVDPSDPYKKVSNVMIWINGRLKGDPPIKMVSDGINDYEYHYREPSGGQYWPWHAFILKNQDPTATYIKIDIKKLWEQLPESLDNKLILPGIEFGNEIWLGSGRIEISRYTINLNGNVV